MADVSEGHESEALRFARRFLGVKSSATPSEIRAAYARRAKVVHPDRFDPKTQKAEWDEANVFLRELNEAYRLLAAISRRTESLGKSEPFPSSTSAPPRPPSASRWRPPPSSRRPRHDPNPPPVGMFDLGMFLVAGVFQFIAGEFGVILFLLVICGVDISLRWSGGKREHHFRKHLLLPRLGLTFICMPMWLAATFFGFLGFLFPWEMLHGGLEWLGFVALFLVAGVSVLFWFADKSFGLN